MPNGERRAEGSESREWARATAAREAGVSQRRRVTTQRRREGVPGWLVVVVSSGENRRRRRTTVVRRARRWRTATAPRSGALSRREHVGGGEGRARQYLRELRSRGRAVPGEREEDEVWRTEVVAGEVALVMRRAAEKRVEKTPVSSSRQAVVVKLVSSPRLACCWRERMSRRVRRPRLVEVSLLNWAPVRKDSVARTRVRSEVVMEVTITPL